MRHLSCNVRYMLCVVGGRRDSDGVRVCEILEGIG
jgi:hypothetical protein